MMQPRNRQKLQSKAHKHDRLIYVRQGATCLKLTCSLPWRSHSCWSTCCSQASHSGPTSWTQIVAHTQIRRNGTKWNKQELKTKSCKNDALENPRRAIELGSLYRNWEAKKTRWHPRSPLHDSWDTLDYLIHTDPWPRIRGHLSYPLRSMLML
jgi:hypothetical protein